MSAETATGPTPEMLMRFQIRRAGESATAAAREFVRVINAGVAADRAKAKTARMAAKAQRERDAAEFDRQYAAWLKTVEVST